MKYKLCFHIQGAIFYMTVEVNGIEDDIDYIAEHIATSLNASLMYHEHIEEK